MGVAMQAALFSFGSITTVLVGVNILLIAVDWGSRELRGKSILS
jgi:hypothetical protein